MIWTWSIQLEFHKRFQEGVGEPGDEQVLHALLAQVVVDAEDLGFLEDRADRVVDGLCRGQVLADRLLQDHPRRFIDQVVGGQMFGDRAEQARRAGQVVHPDLARVGRQQSGQLTPVRGVGEINARVLQTGKKTVNDLIVEDVCGDESAQLAAHFVAVARLVEAGTRRGDDAGVRRELAIPVAQVKGG